MQGVERGTHRLDRGGVGGLFVAPADQLRGGDRRGFGDPHHFEHEHPVEVAAVVAHPILSVFDLPARLGLVRAIWPHASLVENASPDSAKSEARRGGKECVSTCISRWSPYH